MNKASLMVQKYGYTPFLFGCTPRARITNIIMPEYVPSVGEYFTISVTLYNSTNCDGDFYVVAMHNGNELGKSSTKELRGKKSKDYSLRFYVPMPESGEKHVTIEVVAKRHRRMMSDEEVDRKKVSIPVKGIPSNGDHGTGKPPKEPTWLDEIISELEEILHKKWVILAFLVMVIAIVMISRR